ncbi:MAG: right-handed parallel beta-helix repeat-containing protein [Chitinophagaceae bacterium]
MIRNGNAISINHLDIRGFQKAGLLIQVSSNIEAKNVYAHENGYAGIAVAGINAKDNCRNILIRNCKAENNPGDPSNLDNHSGNGIIAGFCKNVTIEYCTATNNGWDMPRKGNGPVGIWCYEADSVIIQHCISYRSKTAAGAADGGGYDFDGGVTNSIIQYCLSYENEGSAFGIFPYAGASKWQNNTIRYNISENDGNVSAAHAGVFVWNSSRDTAQLRTLLFYNNVIYNEGGAAISYERESENAGFRFYNNIFVAKDTLITGKETSVVYLANNWWSFSGGFSMGSIKSLDAWAIEKNKERLGTALVGLNLNPQFQSPGKTTLTDTLQLATYFNYRITENSGLRKSGINLQATYGIDTGKKDFNQQPMLENGIGASF